MSNCPAHGPLRGILADHLRVCLALQRKRGTQIAFVFLIIASKGYDLEKAINFLHGSDTQLVTLECGISVIHVIRGCIKIAERKL